MSLQHDDDDLPKRLGHATGARLLIVTCDDLGASHAANVAIHDALSGGIATGASLMVPCPWAREAARLCGAFPIGVHLTLTSEFPGYRWRGLTAGRSLRDQDGFLHAGKAVAVAAIAAAEAYDECRAQIETAIGWGVDVTHLDAHMDILLLRDDLFTLYLDLATQFRLPVRVADDAQRSRARHCAIVTADRLIYPWPRPAAEVLAESAATLPPGVTEIFVHPVRPGAELNGYDQTFATLRAADAAGMTDPALAACLSGQGIRRISQRDLRALQRGEP